MKYGTGSFIAGVLIVVVSLSKNIFVGADTIVPSQVEFAFKLGIIVGSVLIAISVLLFMLASSSTGEKEQQEEK